MNTFSIISNFVTERMIMFAAPCQGGGFLGLPTWYKYLDGNGTGVECTPVLTGLADVWLIVLAIIEILLRVAVIVAIAYVVFGGIKLIISRANPDKIQQARNTVQDGLIGMVIAVVATAVVSFIAGTISG